MKPQAGQVKPDRGPAKRHLALVALVLALVATLSSRAGPTQAGEPSPDEPPRIAVDASGPGRVFDGVGGISASSSKLLYDYPEPERSRLLDAMFSPRYGASLQLLKTEIGGDTNTTVGAEPSHERERGEVNCDRGVEWWLMKEAEKRNPDIELYSLAWGAPGWFEGGTWSSDQVDYLVDYLDCAAQHGLRIDYLGGTNESYDPPPSPAFFKELDKALAEKHPDVEVVGTDEHAPPDYFAVATEMKKDPEYASAVDILGQHDVCVWRSLYQKCHANQDARDSGKPLWNSEQSSQTAGDGAGPLARAMNRNYLDARVTGNINWAMASGFYGNTTTGGTGLMLAEWPWSGHFQPSASLWVDAHTTQFTSPGWRYADKASGYLPGGSSYVTLRDPRTGDYTIVVETMDAEAPETARFAVDGALSSRDLHQWSTDVESAADRDWFVRGKDVRPADGEFTATFEPGHVYTLSTTRGQQKGDLTPPSTTGERLPLPHREDFEDVGPTGLARYFQDQQGGFEATPCAGDRGGSCYRQAVGTEPHKWHDGGREPTTIVGDPLWWGDYRVSSDALLEEPGHVELLGRIENYDGTSTAGYRFRISDSGAWQLLTENSSGKRTELASGTTKKLGVGTWHRLSLSFRGDTVVPSVDGRQLGTVRDGTHNTGQAGLAVSEYQHAQFDNVEITPTGPAPQLAPRSTLDATASSAHTGVRDHHRYPAGYATDGIVQNQWKTEMTADGKPADALPHSLTLDLGRERTVHGLAYKPPFTPTGRPDSINDYTVSVSSDGENFTETASGSWESTTATKLAEWSPQRAHYVRLTATSSKSGLAAAPEVGILTAPHRGHTP